jgi:hypothetical protein
MPITNQQTALHAIEKALALLQSLHTLEGTDKEGEHFLEIAVKSLRRN